jgi:hypothetical protein
MEWLRKGYSHNGVSCGGAGDAAGREARTCSGNVTLPPYTVVLAVAAALLVAACDTRGQMLRTAEQVRREMVPYFDHAEYSPHTVHSQVVSAAEFLGRPRDLKVIGRYIVVADMVSEHSIHVFDSTTYEHLGSFGRRGRGPGEFTTSPVLSDVPGVDDLVVALDPTTISVTRFRLPQGEIVPLAGRTVLRVPTSHFTYAIEMTDEARGLGLGFFERGRLAHFDLLDEAARYAGPVPGDADNDDFFIRRQQAHFAHLAADPSRTRAIAATRLSSQADIYTVSGDFVGRAESPYEFTVDYMTDGGEFMAGPRTRNGYQSVAATDSLVFALFSGRAEVHFMGMHGSHAEFVHVFDWDGHLDRVIRLDSEVLRIATDKTGSKLFAITERPEPAVLVFSLR